MRYGIYAKKTAWNQAVFVFLVLWTLFFALFSEWWWAGVMLSSLNEDEIEKWKEDMEVRALSEYYKQKIKIEDQKFWCQKAALLK